MSQIYGEDSYYKRASVLKLFCQSVIALLLMDALYLGSNLIYCFQAWIGSDKSFTYDYVFDTASQQEEVYEDTVKGLVDGTFEGKDKSLAR